MTTVHLPRRHLLEAPRKTLVGLLAALAVAGAAIGAGLYAQDHQAKAVPVTHTQTLTQGQVASGLDARGLADPVSHTAGG